MSVYKCDQFEGVVKLLNDLSGNSPLIDLSKEYTNNLKDIWSNIKFTENKIQNEYIKEYYSTLYYEISLDEYYDRRSNNIELNDIDVFIVNKFSKSI